VPVGILHLSLSSTVRGSDNFEVAKFVVNVVKLARLMFEFDTTRVCLKYD